MTTVSSVALMADEDRVLGNMMRRLIEELPCSVSADTFTMAGISLKVSNREMTLLRFVLADG